MSCGNLRIDCQSQQNEAVLTAATSTGGPSLRQAILQPAPSAANSRLVMRSYPISARKRYGSIAGQSIATIRRTLAAPIA
jgi:hypothetical protein